MRVGWPGMGNLQAKPLLGPQYKTKKKKNSDDSGSSRATICSIQRKKRIHRGCKARVLIIVLKSSAGNPNRKFC